MFIRNKKEENSPYITVEIAGTIIRQWYGAYNKKPDKEHIDEWLKGYIAHLTQGTAAVPA